MSDEKYLKRKFFGLDIDDPNTPKKLLLLVIGLWFSCAIVMTFIWNDLSKQGLAGDMFGAVNALFSGLAFAGIIFTILMQKEELSLQREELRLNRQELADTRKEFEKQNETLNVQRFENTFFKLLELHKQVLTEVSVQSSVETLNGTGRDAFVQTNTFLETRMSKWNYDPAIPDWNGAYAKLKDIFDEIFYESRSEFYKHYIPYYRSMLRLIKYVKQSSLIPKADKNQYYFFFYASMFEEEKTLLFYYLTFFYREDTLMRELLEFEVENELFFEEEYETDYFVFHPSHIHMKNTWQDRYHELDG